MPRLIDMETASRRFGGDISTPDTRNMLTLIGQGHRLVNMQKELREKGTISPKGLNDLSFIAENMHRIAEEYHAAFIKMTTARGALLRQIEIANNALTIETPSEVDPEDTE